MGKGARNREIRGVHGAVEVVHAFEAACAKAEGPSVVVGFGRGEGPDLGLGQCLAVGDERGSRGRSVVHAVAPAIESIGAAGRRSRGSGKQREDSGDDGELHLDGFGSRGEGCLGRSMTGRRDVW